MPRPQPLARDKSGYLSEDTIAALATSAGGAVSIVRVSGPDSFRVLRSLASSSPALAPENAEPRKLVRARLVDPDADTDQREVDDALFVRFVAPESFTGEDVVEFHLHGGAFTSSRLLELLGRLGVRQALPGEFSFRAVRNGKMTLSQATAVADLIAASNEGAVSLALEKLSGAQNRLISSLSKELKQVAALGEIGIDFADQDVEEVSLPSLKGRVSRISNSLKSLHESYRRGTFLQEGIGVAFVGLPNAGKSSFFNALLGEDRSIVSEVAGTTRDVIREKMTLRGKRNSITLRLEDTAGLRAANDEVEKMGIERTEKSAKNADVLLLIVDATAPLDGVLDQWKRLGSPATKTVGILTKCDLVSREKIRHLLSEVALLNLSHWVETSALTGAGISGAAETIAEFCAQWTHREPGEILLTRLDQAEAVAAAIEHLNRAESAPEIDLFASDIRQALHSLGPLIGETVPDDILGQIFSEFCIGK